MSGRRGATLLLAAVLPALVACSAPTAEPPPAATHTVAPPIASTRTPAPTPSPQPADPLPAGPVNFLLIGTDARDPADLTGNADTIMVVHLPADREKVYLVSFTRDMWVSIPGLGEGKINSAFSRGGTDTLRQTVSDLLEGTPLNFAVQSNFAGFIAITRALDGFEVENKHASTVTVLSTGRVVEFPQGRITLENTDGLIYVRERKRLPLGDLDRTERQRAALVGIMEKVKERAEEEDEQTFVDLVTMLRQNVKVTGDLDTEAVVALAPLVAGIDPEDVVGLMAPITGFGNRGGASVNLVDERQMTALGEAMAADEMAGYVEEFGTDYAP